MKNSYTKKTNHFNKSVFIYTVFFVALIAAVLYFSGILQNTINAFADASGQESNECVINGGNCYFDNLDLEVVGSAVGQKSDVSLMDYLKQGSNNITLASNNQSNSNIQNTNVNTNAKICGPLFGSVTEYNIPLNFDYKWLYQSSNTSYNSNLALIANMLSTDIYQYAYVKGISGKGVIGSAKTDIDYTYFLKDLGFDNVQFIDLAKEDYDDDINDLAAIVLAHKTIQTQEGNKDIFVSVVRGTQNKGEWTSDLDVGSTSSEYMDHTGSHKYWKNTKHHKGFDVLSNRVSEKIDAYVGQYSTQNSEKSILITGHSRGAAAANILGQMYEDRHDIKPYTYAFSCPLTTLEPKSKAQSYKTIFNFCEKNDLVGHVPLNHWGFTRYGKDIIGDSFADGVYKKTIEDMMSHSFFDSDKTNVINALNSIANNVDEIYTNKQDYTSLSPQEAETWIKILGISDCYKISTYDTNSGKYAREYNDGFFLKASSKILEDMMSLFVKDNSTDSIERAFNAVQTVSDVNQLMQSNDINLSLVKDLIAMKILVQGTNCEQAYNSFSSENKIEMLMPHLTATTLALAKITPSTEMISGTSYGSGNIVLVCILVAIGIAAIIITVVVVKRKKLAASSKLNNA